MANEQQPKDAEEAGPAAGGGVPDPVEEVVPAPSGGGGAVPALHLGALVVLLAGLAVLTWRLDWPGLSEREGAHAAAALAMAADPGTPPLDLAPLFPWLMAPLAARAGSAAGWLRALGLIAALLGPLAIGCFTARPRVPGGSDGRGAARALLVPAVLTTLPLWWLAARSLDPAASGALIGALAFAALLSGDPGRGLVGWRGWCLFTAGALGWLAGAGPVALLAPWAIALLHLALHGRVAALRGSANHRGALLALALLIAVYGAALWGSSAEARALWLAQISDATRSWTEPPEIGIWSLLPWLALLPGAIFLPSALGAALSSERGRLAALALAVLLAVGLLTPFASLTAAILAAPVLAFLVGDALGRRLAARGALWELWLVAGLALFGAAAALVQRVPLPPILALARVDAGFELRLLVSGALLLAAVLLAALLLTRRHAGAAMLAACALAAGVIGAVELKGATIDRALSHRAFLVELNDALGPHARCATLPELRPVAELYLACPVEELVDLDQIDELLGAADRPLHVLASAAADLPESRREAKEEKTELAARVSWLEGPLGWWVLPASPASAPLSGEDAWGGLPAPVPAPAEEEGDAAEPVAPPAAEPEPPPEPEAQPRRGRAPRGSTLI